MIVDPVIKDLRASLQRLIRALANNLTARDNFAPDGTSGQVLTSNGPNTPPSWQSVAGVATQLDSYTKIQSDSQTAALQAQIDAITGQITTLNASVVAILARLNAPIRKWWVEFHPTADTTLFAISGNVALRNAVGAGLSDLIAVFDVPVGATIGDVSAHMYRNTISDTMSVIFRVNDDSGVVVSSGLMNATVGAAMATYTDSGLSGHVMAAGESLVAVATIHNNANINDAQLRWAEAAFTV